MVPLSRCNPPGGLPQWCGTMGGFWVAQPLVLAADCVPGGVTSWVRSIRMPYRHDRTYRTPVRGHSQGARS